MTGLLNFPEFFRWLDRLERFIGTVFLKRRQGAPAAEENLAAFYRNVWDDAAREVGATVEPLGLGVLEISRDGHKVRVHENRTGIDDLVSCTVVRSKPVMSRLLQEEKVPIPKWLLFRRHEIFKAFDFMRSLNGRNCVLKPARGTSGGQGVTTGVHDIWGLCRAVAYVGHWGDSILIEEQIPGDNYRLLYLDGKLLDAVQRKSPSVIADGKTNVEGLVRSLNASRAGQRGSGHSSHTQITVDLDLKNTLRAQNLTLKSVPPSGKVIRLKTASNENGADENVTVTHEMHPSIIEDGERAARISGLRLAGIDFVIPDHTRPLRETGGVILEVNSPPGYFWHYNKAGEAFRLGIPVLQELFKVQMERNRAI